MAKIKNIVTCPRCEESLVAEHIKPEYCPACGWKFSKEISSFEIPETITAQLNRLQDKKKHVQFVLDLPVQVASNILNDALHILQTISGKKVPASDIRDIVGMAIRIGDVAKKYEEYLAAGGSHTPGLLLTTEEQHELQKNRDGGKNAAPVPTPLLAPVGSDERGGD